MPTKRTLRSRGWRPDLSPYQICELLTGEICYPVRNYSGYGAGEGKAGLETRDIAEFITDEMRADWAHHRDELLAFWISGATSAQLSNYKPWLFFCTGGPGTRPWAWWALEDHPEIGEDESEDDYLDRHHLWLPGER